MTTDHPAQNRIGQVNPQTAEYGINCNDADSLQPVFLSGRFYHRKPLSKINGILSTGREFWGQDI